MSKVSNHKAKPQVAGNVRAACPHWGWGEFFIQAYKQRVASCTEQSEVNSFPSATPGRGTEAHAKSNSAFEESELEEHVFSRKHSEIPLT